MTPLTPDQKREIVSTYHLFAAALDGHGDIDANFRAFQEAYRGDTRAYVDGFKSIPDGDRKVWLFRLRTYLGDEIEADFWNEHLTARPLDVD